MRFLLGLSLSLVSLWVSAGQVLEENTSRIQYVGVNSELNAIIITLSSDIKKNTCTVKNQLAIPINDNDFSQVAMQLLIHALDEDNYLSFTFYPGSCMGDIQVPIEFKTTGGS